MTEIELIKGRFYKFKNLSFVSPDIEAETAGRCDKLYRCHPVILLSTTTWQDDNYCRIVSITSSPNFSRSEKDKYWKIGVDLSDEPVRLTQRSALLKKPSWVWLESGRTIRREVLADFLPIVTISKRTCDALFTEVCEITPKQYLEPPETRVIPQLLDHDREQKEPNVLELETSNIYNIPPLDQEVATEIVEQDLSGIRTPVSLVDFDEVPSKTGDWNMDASQTPLQECSEHEQHESKQDEPPPTPKQEELLSFDDQDPQTLEQEVQHLRQTIRQMQQTIFELSSNGNGLMHQVTRRKAELDCLIDLQTDESSAKRLDNEVASYNLVSAWTCQGCQARKSTNEADKDVEEATEDDRLKITVSLSSQQVMAILVPVLLYSMYMAS